MTMVSVFLFERKIIKFYFAYEKPPPTLLRPSFRTISFLLRHSGGPCRPGYYCPEGSVIGEPCPEGTYVGHPGSENISSCVQCDEGKYCAGTNLSAPTDDCAPGYFCPLGQTRKDPPEYVCIQGVYSCDFSSCFHAEFLGKFERRQSNGSSA